LSVSYPSTSAWNGSGLTQTSGPKYTYSFDAMRRPTGLTDQNNNTVVNNVTYNAANQLLTFNTETHTYNNLNQMTRLTITGTAPLDQLQFPGRNEQWEDHFADGQSERRDSDLSIRFAETPDNGVELAIVERDVWIRCVRESVVEDGNGWSADAIAIGEYGQQPDCGSKLRCERESVGGTVSRGDG
jgi:hypothetical protein